MRILIAASLFLATISTCFANMINRTIGKAYDLSKDLESEASADTATPFFLTARVSTVCCCDKCQLISVEDKSGFSIVILKNHFKGYRPSAGDLIKLKGRVMIDESIRREAFVESTELLSHGISPKPCLTTIKALLRGDNDYRFVRLSGTVYDARISETNAKWAHLTIANNSDVIYASIFIASEEAFSFESLVGSEVLLDGICSPSEYGYRIHLHRTIKAHGLKSIRILRDASQGLSSLPDISTLAHAKANEIPRFRRHKASGKVVAVWNGQAVLMTTNNAMLQVSFASSNRHPTPGQTIDVFGFPETDLFNVHLTRASWQVNIDNRDSIPIAIGEEHPIFIQDMVRAQRRQSELHGKTIQTTGTVLAFSSDNGRSDILYLMNNERMIPIYINETGALSSSIPIGAKVEVTGICLMKAELWHPHGAFPRAHGLVLVTRTPADIRVIESPPWWTPARLLAIIGTLFATLIAIFIWNVALRKIAARKGRELFKEQLGHVKADLRTEERTRLAVELHDTLAQNLTGVSMEIEAANELRGNAPQPMLDHLGIAAKALKSCRDELRNCLWDLRSQALEEQDMTKAVHRTLQPHINDSQLAVRFNVPRSRLSDNTAHALLRVIRELVVNAIRHGNASSVKVAGTIDKEKLFCSVTDNGCGFDPDAAPGVLQGHFGLEGIRERINEIGGTFELSSSQGKGTRAVITLSAPTNAPTSVGV